MCARLVTVKLAKLGLFRFIEECVKFRGNKTRERKFNAKFNEVFLGFEYFISTLRTFHYFLYFFHLKIIQMMFDECP